ncbi:substrate-binding domain-containing protein [Rhodobacterales bacterium HKCCE2091]|nr:substrate-binding domain-containing protein [Rhodobacterales bacterium HKCCE2091]
MARRATIPDLAAAAGVSVATVDRVLNARAPVREETARRVFEAARRIGYHGAGLIERRLQPDLPELTVGYVFHKEKQAFYQSFRDEAEAAAAGATDMRARALVTFSPSQSPGDFVERMEALAERVDAIAATAVTHVEVTDCVQRLQDRGIPCFALLNDFAQGVRKSYIGLNNMKVGRIAAHMIATAMHRPGKVAVFVGGYRWHGHELRETGFRSYLREFAPQVVVLDTLVNLETRQLTYEATLDLLARHPDLAGIYCAGGGMEGAIAALREAKAPGDVALVVNELTPESRKGLADRFVTMVISTPLGQACADVTRLAALVRDGDSVPVPGQHFLRPDLYLPESV